MCTCGAARVAHPPTLSPLPSCLSISPPCSDPPPMPMPPPPPHTHPYLPPPPGSPPQALQRRLDRAGARAVSEAAERARLEAELAALQSRAQKQEEAFKQVRGQAGGSRVQHASCRGVHPHAGGDLVASFLLPFVGAGCRGPG